MKDGCKILPVISIITPCLNRVGFVIEAIESVLNQDYPHTEHIIMDGGSTDGTLEVLDRYSHLRILSEPDNGLYDAINKGISIAQGDVIGLLNTDDVYEPNVFGSVINKFNDNPPAEALVGGATIFSKDDHGKKYTILSFPSISNDQMFYRLTLGAPIPNAWFFRKNLFNKLGNFNIRYRYAADRDFLFRLALENIRYICLNHPVYHYQLHEGSLTLDGKWDGEAEFMSECRVLAEHYLKRTDILGINRKHFLKWHSDITSGQTLSAFRKHNIRRALSYAEYGMQNNPWWTIVFSQRVTLAAIRRIRNLFGISGEGVNLRNSN